VLKGCSARHWRILISSKSSSREKADNFSARLTFTSGIGIPVSSKWVTNFHPASQLIGPGPYIWMLTLMLMQLTIDAVHWNGTYVADGNWARATLKN
jgi:hypothetical protein